MDNPFIEPVERLFAEIATPAAVRAVEDGGAADSLWRHIEESGFLDALVPEEAGGAGLGLTDAFPLLMLAGRHAVPMPFAQTVLARAWLSEAGIESPDGSIALAGTGASHEAGMLMARNVGFARVARWVLADVAGSILLLPAAGATIEPVGGRGSLDATLRWSGQPDGAREIPALPSRDTTLGGNAAPRDTTLGDSATLVNVAPRNAAFGNHASGHTARLRDVEAALYAALIAGAAERVLTMTLDHAGQRTQFGKPISRFQAVQNQLSVMAEQTWAVRMAAQLACRAEGWRPRPLLAALGKSRCSEAAPLIADIAHAVHGAIGITEEYDLQLYTRRLRAWRLAAGSESHWAAVVGEAVLRRPGQSALSFIVDEFSAEHV